MQTKDVLLSAAGLSMALALLAAVPAAAGAAEVAKEVIAAQIRRQGYPCPHPKSAERSGETPLDDARWILHCEGVTYKVTLVPNMAATVERLPESSSEGASEGQGQSR